MDELSRHILRKRVLRMALKVLPDVWANQPKAALRICDEIQAALSERPASGTFRIDNPKSIEAIKNAVDVALAALPDYAFRSRYPAHVSDVVKKLMNVSQWNKE